MNTSLEIPQTSETPYVYFDLKSNHFEILGRSLPEDAAAFFSPILNWLNAYAQNPNPITNVDVKLEYYNSASARKILEIFVALAKAQKNGSHLQINWIFDDDDDLLREAGEEISSLSGVKFTMVTQNS